MLTTTAPDKRARSATSSTAWAMMGEAPAASKVLALKAMTTRLVRLCTKGACVRTAQQSDQTVSAFKVELRFTACLYIKKDRSYASEHRSQRGPASLRWYDPDQVRRVFLSPEGHP